MTGPIVRFAARQLRRNPLSSAAVILTLTLGIGVNTAVFSILDGFLLRKLPYARPERIAALVVHKEGPGQGKPASEEDDSFDGSSWQLLKSSLGGVTFASWGGSGGVNLKDGAVVRYAIGSRVSARYFDVLGIPLHLGRGFSEQEDLPHGPAVVVLSYALWASTFNSDPRIIGESIELKGEPHTVVGILPRSAVTPGKADLFTPLRPSTTGECGGENCGILVRLKPDAAWSEVNAQLSRLRLPYFSELEARHGRAWIYARPLQLELAGDTSDKAVALMLAVGFILLIACANLAGLTLARVHRRAQEIATRFALGASRFNVLCELWAENLMLALLGGAGGVGLALLMICVLRGLLPDSMIPIGDFSVGGRLLAFSLGASFLASLLFGALPALQTRRLDLRSSLASGSRAIARGSSRVRQALIGAEVALTVVLLAAAGLLIRTLIHLETLPPGFDSHNVMTATASLDDARYHDAAGFHMLLDKSIAAMRRIPGVEDAAAGLSLPYERGLNNGITIMDGKKAGSRTGSSLGYVTPGYFSSLRIPSLAGRTIVAIDTPRSEPVAVVNSAFARRFFDDPAPVGYHFKTANTVYTIVGVVADVAKSPGMQRSAPISTEPVAYLPASQTSQALVNVAHIWFQPSWIVRTRGPVTGLTASMQRALAEADPNLPFSGFRSMDQILAEQLREQRIEVLLLATLASLALLLSAIGIYALVSNLVVQRTREIGIRMALGSTTKQAMLHVGSSGFSAAAVGLAAGLGLCFLTLRFLSNQIYGIGTYDPLTLLAVLLILAAIAGAASLLPTLRISRIQPADTLRSE
ncbi:MAG: ADOP family duplicated permease [Acidobacteriia bacterium]|nr:ADOP family duplicated permease [Terriglobia bacterium]